VDGDVMDGDVMESGAADNGAADNGAADSGAVESGAMDSDVAESGMGGDTARSRVAERGKRGLMRCCFCGGLAEYSLDRPASFSLSNSSASNSVSWVIVLDLLLRINGRSEAESGKDK
jgi:hypothetical protein